MTTYNEIMQLHVKIQDFPELDLSGDGEDSQGSEGVAVGNTLQRTYLSVLKEIGEQLSSIDIGNIKLLIIFSIPIPTSAWLCSRFERLS